MPTIGICKDCNKNTSSKYVTRCRSCFKQHVTPKISRQEYSRFWQTNKKYGIDKSGFEVLWIAFRGKCGICDAELIQPTEGKGQPRNACVIDHDHITGNIRGLLCNSCNKGLGLFNDDVVLLRSAINWMEQRNEKASNN